MKGSIKLFTVSGISVKLHITFVLLLFLVLQGGTKWAFLTVSIFCFVILHELCHAFVAKRFGIPVREITLYPIGGVASMSRLPDKPVQEFLISAAGPLFNILVIIIFFFPLKALLGADVIFHPLSTATWPLTFAYVYWINLMLASFNLIPAFPMDGGRILRAVLARSMGYHKATRIAVNMGRIFSLIFAAVGVIRFNIFLIVIALFIYMAASGEEAQVGGHR